MSKLKINRTVVTLSIGGVPAVGKSTPIKAGLKEIGKVKRTKTNIFQATVSFNGKAYKVESRVSAAAAVTSLQNLLRAGTGWRRN